MLKKLILGSLLAACSLAHADTHWEFTWQGFYTYPGAEEFHPDYIVSGTFTGNDLNGNQVLEQSELTELIIDNRNFTTCSFAPSADYCGVDAFSYAFGGALALEASYATTYHDDWGWSQSGIEYSSEYGVNHISRAPNQYDDYGWSMSDRTIVTVTAVPEPQTYAMLGAGMLMLAGMARRRK